MKTKRVGDELFVFDEEFLNYEEQEFYSHLLTALRLARVEMFARRVPVIVNRYGSATYKRTLPYSPAIPTGVFFALEINETERISRDVAIFYHSPLKAFKASLPGVYSINVVWHIDIPEPNLMTHVVLWVYKNGLPWRLLDDQPMVALIPLGTNAFHIEATLQGTADIDLLPEDYFDIRLMHDKAAGFGIAEHHGGHIDIDYNHNWSNT